MTSPDAPAPMNGGGGDRSPSMFDLLQWMDDQTSAAFAAAVHRRRFRAGQTLYYQGERGEEMFRIAEGSVRLSVTRSDGREAIFLFLEAGDCFGDSSLVDDDVRPQTAEAVTDVEVQALGRSSFTTLRRDHRSFEEAVMRLLARQMRVISGHYVDSSLSDLSSRVAARIMECAGPPAPGEEGSLRVTRRLSQTDLASMVGASRQSVNKTLQAFRSRGLIAIQSNHIVVHEPEELQRLADAD